MRTVALPLAAVVLLVAAAALAGVGPATAGGTHGNHLRADVQLSDDGTVVVETAFLLQDGYVAIHATDADGQPGEVLAARRLDSGFHSPVDLQVDAAYWENQSGPVRLWAVLHDDDGDDTFEPDGDDQPLRSFGSLSGARFLVGTGEGKASVVAASYSARRTTGNVTVPRVSLPADGYLVLRDDDTGQPAGHVALPTGTHENVTVSLTDAYRRNASGEPQSFLRATLYRDDGDGVYDPATDDPVRVDNVTVASTFGVRVPEGAVSDPGNGTATTTADVNTPSTTTALVNTPSATETPVTTPTAAPTPTAVTTTTDPSSSVGAPGFGLGVAVVALLAAALLALRRR